MSRHRFGGVADYVVGLGDGNAAILAPAVTVTCWNMAVGGTQYTDLVQTDGTTPIAGGELTTDATGSVPEFYGPDGVTAVYLDANAGSGPRRRTIATDLGSSITSVRGDLDVHTGAVNPHGTKWSDLSGVYAPSGASLLASAPFYVAHRGSGAEFPEHTLAAYTAALAAGAKAIEVSVHTTADGVPVCFHDTTLDRMTNQAGPIAEWAYAQLREQVRVQAQGLLGSGWADQPISTLEEVMQALYGRCVIFLEPKSNASIPIVQDWIIERYPDAARSVVWKAYYTSTSFPWAHSHGFTTWGYFFAADNVTDAQLNAADTGIDWWGVEHKETDTRFSQIVARGKPVIAHQVHRRSTASRVIGLGAQGIMCSRLIYNTADLTGGGDKFASKVAAPGYIGTAVDDPSYALQFDGAGGAYIPVVPNQAVLMGRHKAPADDAYIIHFSMKWDTVPTTTSLHSDVAFGKADDDKFTYFATDNSAGYTMFVRATGEMQLYTHAPGTSASTQLGTVMTEAPVAGQYMDFEIEVTATQVILRRTDTATTYTLTVNDTQYRGRYWHLSVGSVNNIANKPTWSGISVSATP